MGSSDRLFVGLMSGTSIDGIDAALVRCTPDATVLVATHEHPIPPTTREQIASISASGPDEIERLGPLDRAVGQLFADATLNLLASAGVARQAITAIGSHGQTIRHRPPSGDRAGQPFTLQIGDPNTIAEDTGITTVADFRRRDVAAGGEGAPLAPAFHAVTMAAAGRNRAIINIGGIANASVLKGTELIKGFDTGPGNALLDAWIRRCRGLHFDSEGNWAASGTIDSGLLAALLENTFFDLQGKRSTGKETFNLPWLEKVLTRLSAMAPEHVQSTLAEFTATTIARAVDAGENQLDEIYICGGGAKNLDLLRRLERHLAPVPVRTTTELGIDPDWVEAMAFAWLAARTLDGLPGNSPRVTGAAGPRILGGIYPG